MHHRFNSVAAEAEVEEVTEVGGVEAIKVMKKVAIEANTNNVVAITIAITKEVVEVAITNKNGAKMVKTGAVIAEVDTRIRIRAVTISTEMIRIKLVIKIIMGLLRKPRKNSELKNT